MNTARPTNQRTWRQPPADRPRKRTHTWLGIAAAIAAVIAAVPVIPQVIDWLEDHTAGVEVITVRLDQPTPIDAVETRPDADTGQLISKPITTDAAVIDLTLVNRSDEVRVLTRLGVTVSRLVKLTGCASGDGGPIGVSAVYPLELPEPGKSAEHPVTFELPPEKADRLALTLGPADDNLNAVYRLDLYAIDDADDRIDLGTAVIAAPPAPSALYSGDVTLLPQRHIPRLDCVRQLRHDLEAAIDDTSHVARQVRDLLDRVRSAEHRLTTAGRP